MKRIIMILIVLSLTGCIFNKEHQVTVKTEEGGYYLIEVITQASFADYQLPTEGTRTL